MSKQNDLPAGTGPGLGNAPERRRFTWKQLIAVVGGVTAILTLAFSLQRLTGMIGDWREQGRRVDELIALAATQQQTRHFAEAWASLAEAERVDSGREDVRRAQEDIAMEWVREARVRQGEQTFSDLVQPLVPVLQRGALRADGQRRADLLAHTGWADYLRWRDGARELEIDAHYRQALASDAGNPFAHAMWGHWILFRGGDVDSARAHFDAALRSGRERDYVRGLQIAALLNLPSERGASELLRFADEVRRENGKLSAADSRRILSLTCIMDVVHGQAWEPSPGRLTPRAEITTLQWLYAATEPNEYHADMLRFCEARAHAWSGDTARALSMLRALETAASGDATRRNARNAADRLTSSAQRRPAT